MKVSCELDPAPIGKNIPAPIEEMFQAKIRGVMTESGKQFVTYFRPRRNASEVTSRPGRRNAKDKFSADQSPVPSWWNSHITYSLPAAKNNFQTTHGLVQTHPSFGKPAHRPAGSHRSPTRAPGLRSVSCTLAPVPPPELRLNPSLSARTSATKENRRGSATTLPWSTTSCWERKFIELPKIHFLKTNHLLPFSSAGRQEVGRSDRSASRRFGPSWWTRASRMLVEWTRPCASLRLD
ncbi:uncharacterized protein LOC120431853 isoform X2 [Culex pipiens pallens]|uniref:uncharacterized protein LOC120431853 isoform X2 n=1 Tax=Culex pipiens pallens TaxID=42434 RepID=UPI001952AF5E|nr:uncharacterized protein LOC120431853 isoform X2 [Culex pipiens pallens]